MSEETRVDVQAWRRLAQGRSPPDARETVTVLDAHTGGEPLDRFGVLFLHNEGYSSMCGHRITAALTAMFETGVLPAALTGRGTSWSDPADRLREGFLLR